MDEQSTRISKALNGAVLRRCISTHVITVQQMNHAAFISGDGQARYRAALRREQDHGTCSKIQIGFIQAGLIRRSEVVTERQTGVVQGQAKGAVAIVTSADICIESAISVRGKDISVTVC